MHTHVCSRANTMRGHERPDTSVDFDANRDDEEGEWDVWNDGGEGEVTNRDQAGEDETEVRQSLKWKYDGHHHLLSFNN